MRVGIVNFSQIAALLLVLSLELPAPAQAVTYWNESFEGNLSPNWDTAACGFVALTGCNPASSTDFAVNGTHSLKGTYTGAGGGTWMDRTFPATDDLYFRVWIRFASGFSIIPGEQVKGFNLGDNIFYPNFWWSNGNGSTHMTVGAQGPVQSGSGCGAAQYDFCNFYDNVGSVTEMDNAWHCIEGHVLMNTPGSSNGVLEKWADGTQTMRYTGYQFRGPNPTNCPAGCQNSSTATFKFIRVYVQAQAAHGSKYYDDLAVGNTRIGCGSAPAPTADTTPPAAPVGLVVR